MAGDAEDFPRQGEGREGGKLTCDLLLSQLVSLEKQEGES